MEPMKVIIKQRELSYTSDYPDGWQFTAGDPYKFPVLIGDAPCFIKRFEQKGPEDISGWDLLTKMSGKYEKTLARIYDIKNVQEEEKDIYYVFYEYLDGVTLDAAVKAGGAVNLSHLTEDLFNGVRALQKYGFWFADFTEKNIFCQKDGSFVLVDVDSTQRITDLPDNDMYGSKDYWILVLKYYKEVLNKNDLRLTDINGISLNYLMIAFLVLRMKLFSLGKDKDYNSTRLFNGLPSKLNAAAPELQEIFLNINKNGKQPLSPDDITSMQDIVDRKIVRGEIVNGNDMDPQGLPAITEFKTNAEVISSGGSFTLSWKVDNADKLELNKNGALFKTLEATQSDITLTEFDDGTRRESIYFLNAYKGLAMAKSNPVTVRMQNNPVTPVKPLVKPPPPPPAWRKWLLIIGGILAAIILYFVFRPGPDTPPPSDGMKVSGIQPETLHENKDSVFTIYGSGFPKAGSVEYSRIKVTLNGLPATIAPASQDHISVMVPISQLKHVIPGDPMKIPIQVTSLSDNLYSDTITCVLNKDIMVGDFIPKNLLGQRVVVFSGNNLTPSGNFVIKINGVNCPITYNNNVLIVNAPALAAGLSSVPVEVDAGGKVVYSGVGNTLVYIFHTPEYLKNLQEIEKVKTMTKRVDMRRLPQ